MSYWKLWTALGLVIVLSFAVLGYYGLEIYRQAPPIPAQVVTTEGEVLFTGQNIRDGQNVWQSTGGQQMGTIWGHGSYVAPDWSADWLHREAVWLMNYWAKEDYGVESYEELEPEAFAALKARLKGELRTNSYNPETETGICCCGRSRLRRSAIIIPFCLVMMHPWMNWGSICDSPQRDQGSGASGVDERILLLGSVVMCRQSPRTGGFLHAELAT